MTLHPLFAPLDRIYVINLPHRTDRRAEMAIQLGRVGLSFESSQVTLFPAIRPEDMGHFPSIGARGCYLSHLEVWRDAIARKARTILILEDDAYFARPLFEATKEKVAALYSHDWGMAYLGCNARGPLDLLGEQKDFQYAPPTTDLVLAHAVLARHNAITRLVPFLEAILTRPPGDPAGGPMHVDGAYNWFRRANPELRTLVTYEQWAVQRSSRTDIAQTGWKERLPLLGTIRRLRNRFRDT